MKPIRQTLKEIFAPAALALSALAIAVPMSTADAAVRNMGPTVIIHKQMANEGYEPVGGGYIESAPNAGILAFFKKPNNEWLATRGNSKTTEVVMRGTDLKVKEWEYTIPVSFENAIPPVAATQVNHQGCPSFDQVQDTVLKNKFDHATLLEGRTMDGNKMKAFVKDGDWLALGIKQDADSTTCPLAQGSGFRMAETVSASALTPAPAIH